MLLKHPLAKAIVPAVLTILVVLVQLLLTDDGSKPELITAIVGLGSAVLTYFTTGWALKALNPAILTVVTVGVVWVVSGTFSKAELAAALMGLFAALSTLLGENVPPAVPRRR